MGLRAKDLDFYYANQQILEKVCFEALAGEVVAVLGVNGAGKSTLLRCLAGILKPQSGEIVCLDSDTSSISRRESAKLFGYVPQANAAEKSTVFESVLLGRRPHYAVAPGRADYLMAEEVLNRLGLGGLAFRKLEELSGGQARKVSVARALAQKPQVLLMDEPTSGLDLKSRLELAEVVRQEVESRNICAVVATHDLALALGLADKIVLIKGRKVLDVVDVDDFGPEHVKLVFEVEAVLAEVAGRKVVVPLAAC